MTEHIHTCGYHCERPDCIKAQRDELRDTLDDALEAFERGRQLGVLQERAVWEMANASMDEAIAAGDGTLHGAIDYWQERALKAEAAVKSSQEPNK